MRARDIGLLTAAAALILDQGERLQLVCQGYLPLPTLRERLTAAARPAG